MPPPPPPHAALSCRDNGGWSRYSHACQTLSDAIPETFEVRLISGGTQERSRIEISDELVAPSWPVVKDLLNRVCDILPDPPLTVTIWGQPTMPSGPTGYHKDC